MPELLAYVQRLFSKEYMWTPLRRLAPYVWRQKKSYLGLIIVMLLNVISSLSVAKFLQSFTEAALNHNMSAIPWMFAIGVAVITSAGVLAFLETYLRSTVIQAVEREVQNELFSHTLRMKMQRLESYPSGDLMTRLTYDIHRIGAAVGLHMLHFIRLLIMGSGAFVYLMTLNVDLTLIAISIIPPVAVFSLVISRWIRTNNLKISQAISQLQAVLIESMRGLLVIRAFKLEDTFARKFERKTRKIYSLQRQNSRLAGAVSATGSMSHFISFLLSFSFGAYYVAMGRISIGDLIAFMTLIQYLVGPMMSAPRELGGYQAAMAATTRIWTILDEDVEASQLLPDAADKSHPGVPFERQTKTLSRLAHSVNVEFENVSFTYPHGTQALRGVSLAASQGTTLALVGPNGAGKSTVFKLLLGLYDLDFGEIRLNDIPIRHLGKAEIRRLISYVPQETFLFTGTVLENIRYGKQYASEGAVKRAAMAANADDFICALPQGYDTVIGESGLRLSGGQCQRIAIARALLQNAPILLLDEATASLDTESEYLVQDAISRLMAGRTTFVIAHRLSTVRNVDCIFVLDEGRIVEQGTHEELLLQRGLYERLYHLQFAQTDEDPSAENLLVTAVRY